MSLFATVSRRPCLSSLGQGPYNLDSQGTESKEGKQGNNLFRPLPIGFSGQQATLGTMVRTTVTLLSQENLVTHPPTPPHPIETVADLNLSVPGTSGMGARGGV